MEEIVVISSTNRPNSNTLKVSKVYEGILRSKSIGVKLLDFQILPENIAFGELFGNRSEGFNKIIEEFVVNTKKFIFVVPEYNGSFPGILKLFLDSVHPKFWENKEVCLVGVSTGRAGNLRGMDHLTGVLNYLKMHVYHNKLPISMVDRIMDENGNFISEDQLKVCKLQVEGYLTF